MSQQTPNNFRSSFINNVLSLFYSAENIINESKNRNSFNLANFKGQLLDEKSQIEKQLCQRNLETICNQIEKLLDNELELLSKTKEHELQHPYKETLENLEILKDIITEDELQLYADKCKTSEFVQRRISSIADEKQLHVRTYPGFDKKIETAKEIASTFINFIKYKNWGMEPAIYIKTTLQEYDNILEPISGGVE